MDEVVVLRSLYQRPVFKNHLKGCGLAKAACTLFALGKARAQSPFTKPLIW